MKIAVVGAGITGMGAALALSETHDVTLFEKQGRFGGHADTQRIQYKGQDIAVDTGFIVYNFRNYPNLTGLFQELDVPTKWSDMSFGLSLNGGEMEFAFDTLDKIFAQRKNAFNPRYIRLLKDIKRFNASAAKLLDDGAMEGLSLGEWLADQGFSDWFRDRFLLPMGGAIWSTPTDDILDFPAANFVTFFRNHDLMTGLEPAQRWRTVEGGSREYVNRLMARLGSRAVSNAEVVAVSRKRGPELTFADGSTESFDQVILATHGPTSNALMTDKTEDEAAILGAFKTSSNRAVLHSDPTLMPKRKKVWSSWNFLSNGADAGRPAPVTYWMNRLQSIPNETPLFVSLNPDTGPDPALTHGTYNYAHPLFDRAAIDAQQSLDRIQGTGGVWYAGAWASYGFHEDGLTAGLRVVDALGARPNWAKNVPNPIRGSFAAAAE